MHPIEREVREKLFALQDKAYQEFQKPLIPTVAPEAVIGVRTPALRKFAREFGKSPEALEFMKLLPHMYYEENNLHAFLIEGIGDYDKTIAAVDEFLPYIDNWATCDMKSPKVFYKHRPELLEKINEWIRSDHTYTIRFAIKMLMTHFLDEDFDPAYLSLVASVHSEEYYVRMMVAWYFATALHAQYEATLPILEDNRLEIWTHNKTIQKAVESYRITDEQKTYLRSRKRKAC